jgi:hypothetical protein
VIYLTGRWLRYWVTEAVLMPVHREDDERVSINHRPGGEQLNGRFRNAEPTTGTTMGVMFAAPPGKDYTLDLGDGSDPVEVGDTGIRQ